MKPSVFFVNIYERSDARGVPTMTPLSTRVCFGTSHDCDMRAVRSQRYRRRLYRIKVTLK